MLRIVPIAPAEAPELSQLATEAFRAAFGAYHPPADLAAYLAQALSEAALANALAQPANQFYWLQAHGRPAGFAHLNTEDVPPAPAPVLGLLHLHRFYLVPSQVGQPGLAQHLMDHCLQTARQGGYSGAWLGVWQQNHRAIRFYEKNGFAVFGTTRFELGQQVDDDYLMAKVL
ncbi:MAG: GNAT family N-acetyltransferase [Bernardetiaceae bacterium]|jgi:ribosomal protein S18 acetylase RimI-like enzyme|nr:GNAT family N-acetyltransferase [Bernardetiaceae bacterium]